MSFFSSLGVAAAGLALSSAALAQGISQRVDFGKKEYESNCAVCHGMTGKGDGPIVELLTKSPPDLRQLAQKNGGVLPLSRLYEVIDGGGVAAHGSRDMPIWGHDYKLQAAEYYFEVPYDPEAYTRAKILALLEYISRLQVK